MKKLSQLESMSGLKGSNSCSFRISQINFDYIHNFILTLTLDSNLQE